MFELKHLFILLCFLIFGALLYILGRISANKETKFGIKERFIKKIKKRRRFRKASVECCKKDAIG